MVMSTSAISGNGYWQLNPPSSLQKIEKEFQQLGSDLQSGNLTAAQADFVTLQQDLPQTSSSSAQTSSNPIEQAFSQLSQDLKAGNLTAAQQDFQTIQQDFQNRGPQWSQPAQGTEGEEGHRHDHHFHNESGSSSGNQSGSISQLMSKLGQELQSGDLTSAQQTFTSLQSAFGQFDPNGEQQSSTASDSTSSTASDSTSSTISVSA
jgi:hypothetical protein